VIRAGAWYCADNYGVFAPGGASWEKPSPASSATADILALIDRPVKYFGRLTTDSRLGLCAASMALRATPWQASSDREIGIVSSSPDGCLRDHQAYFQDYVESGRTLGRGNLFIYTLPTSVAGEIAIALTLTGPCMFVQDDVQPLTALVRHAQRLVADGEADGMLALYSDPQAALCFAIDAGERDDTILKLLADPQSTPSGLIRDLQTMVPKA
jgi:3-oxoacyl-(acyl-carrier-protein) synthase